MNINYYKDTQVEKFESFSNFEIFIKREDQTFGGFGVKLRKAHGLIQFLKQGQVKDVLLYGNPHSNFLSTYSTILRYEGFNVYSLFYTHDQNLNSANSILSKRSAHSFMQIGSKSNRGYYIQEFRKGFSNGFVIPEFGIHESSLASLNSLWRDIEKSMNWDYLFLDIGTGFTILSALNYFKEKEIQLIGVSIGNKINKIQADLEANAERLKLDKQIFTRLKILEPSVSPSFASKNKTLEDWLINIWQTKKIPLEPIYSAKTMYTILKYIKSSNLTGKGIYVHQGGLLNHLHYFI